MVCLEGRTIYTFSSLSWSFECTFNIVAVAQVLSPCFHLQLLVISYSSQPFIF